MACPEIFEPISGTDVSGAWSAQAASQLPVHTLPTSTLFHPSSPSQKFLKNFSGSLEFRGWTAGSA
ncbi:ORF128 [White spot syndrome virus]|uniref:Wsv062 n=4 Tax=White spot syndrome virus TaxID=342409 RepID=Q8VBB2_WSSVS|nr:wsv062 [Shrimp white spot syndrome virus]AFX59440.1 wsv062 [White spot syndrome virus]AAL33066.1 wsv062 [Shrimp white spot syndrome virus]AAL88987.1 WSSV119 [Shrimp white spot syndrome virus]ATU84087.1 ORF128 [White spot syndrome virus]AWQ62358.1 wsv062 [Shrimp white spot syndrome virus]